MKKLKHLVAFIPLIPVVPFWIISEVGKWLLDRMDDIIEFLFSPLLSASRWLERKMKIDFDTEYEEWRERMKKNRTL